MTATCLILKKPSMESQNYLLTGGCSGNHPSFPTNPDEPSLLTEIEKLFGEDEKQVEERPKTGVYFHTSPFNSTQKSSRRNSFHCRVPSREWFKLSPKSKFQRKSKKMAKLYRNKSDSHLHHWGLCSIKTFPTLTKEHSFKSLIIPFTPVAKVQRQLFTPDSGYDSTLEDVNGNSTPRRPKYIIGSHIRSSKLDIVHEIQKRVPELITKILVYLSEKDLTSFVWVSKCWREVLSHERRDDDRRLAYVKKKKNEFQAKKETAKPQRLQASLSFLSSNSLRSSRHEEFWQAKQSLRDGEMLMKCHCGSPATISSSISKATCNKCQSNICTNCGSCYHGNKPCQKSSRISGSGILTPTSRRNLRRL
ncbi:hypothetical protein BSL78_24659 [Apostichopus japonicus]|uniref:F-box only protein 43 n=1 Tax=Stichopus japonicus TaxID=307972 RepID=A0A2G8JRV6_STIJA|nr:hypothetical protein BSL78_24659 [Apostichopus japonicus]